MVENDALWVYFLLLTVSIADARNFKTIGGVQQNILNSRWGRVKKTTSKIWSMVDEISINSREMRNA